MAKKINRNYFTSLVLLVFIVIGSCAPSAEKKKTVIPDSAAVFKGEKEMGWVIAHYMIYPDSESNVNRAGTVYVSWTVNTSGDVENIKAELRKNTAPAETAIARKRIKGKEVLEINRPVIDNLMHSIQLLKFLPAVKDGKPVASEISTSVEFILI